MDGAVLDDLGTRAIDETGTIALLTDKVPDFPAAIALTRIPQLKARLELVKDKPNFIIEYALSGEGDTADMVAETKQFITGLTLKADGVKAGYRCGDPASVKAPKKILDEAVTSFVVKTDDVSAIQNAVNAFGPAKELQFTIDEGDIQFMVSDENGDSFSTSVGSSTYDGKLSHSYNAVNISALLKLALVQGSVNIGISERGILSIDRGLFTFYVMPSKIGNS